MVEKALHRMPVADCGDYEEVIVRAERDKKSPWREPPPQEKKTHINRKNKTQINNLIKRFS